MEESQFYDTRNSINNFDHILDRYMLNFETVSINGQFQIQLSGLSESTTEKQY